MTLPVELLELVFTNLDTKSDPKVLLKCTHVSTQFWHLAKALLFRHLSIVDSSVNDSLSFLLNERYPIISLVRSLSVKFTASTIETLTLCRWSSERDPLASEPINRVLESIGSYGELQSLSLRGHEFLVYWPVLSRSERHIRRLIRLPSLRCLELWNFSFFPIDALEGSSITRLMAFGMLKAQRTRKAWTPPPLEVFITDATMPVYAGKTKLVKQPPLRIGIYSCNPRYLVDPIKCVECKVEHLRLRLNRKFFWENAAALPRIDYSKLTSLRSIVIDTSQVPCTNNVIRRACIVFLDPRSPASNLRNLKVIILIRLTRSASHEVILPPVLLDLIGKPFEILNAYLMGPYWTLLDAVQVVMKFDVTDLRGSTFVVEEECQEEVKRGLRHAAYDSWFRNLNDSPNIKLSVTAEKSSLPSS